MSRRILYPIPPSNQYEAGGRLSNRPRFLRFTPGTAGIRAGLLPRQFPSRVPSSVRTGSSTSAFSV
jgi:hypothetical protein